MRKALVGAILEAMGQIGRVVCALALLVAMTAHARADDPWATGVSKPQKLAANKLLDEGNALFLDRQYREALDKYVAATKEWDHPAIEFNIARCLILLEKPVEASEHLAAALKYGAAPLEERVYEEALAYQKLLANQIGDISVSCRQPGVKVTLDGQPFVATCPGQATRRLVIGQHQVVGVRAGFLTDTRDVVVVGGKPQEVDITLQPLGKAAKLTRRWSTWKPWLVFGTGLAAVAVGGGLDAFAASQMRAFDNAVATQCARTGCNGPGSIETISTKPRDTAKLESRIGVGLLSAGAAATVTGVVLLYMNRTHTIYEHTVVTPVAGGAAVTLVGAF